MGRLSQKAVRGVPEPHKRVDALVGVVDVRAAAEAVCVECRKGMSLYVGQDEFGTPGVLFHRILKHKKQPERFIRCLAADVWGLPRVGSSEQKQTGLASQQEAYELGRRDERVARKPK